MGLSFLALQPDLLYILSPFGRRGIAGVSAEAESVLSDGGQT